MAEQPESYTCITCTPGLFSPHLNNLFLFVLLSFPRGSMAESPPFVLKRAEISVAELTGLETLC